MTLLCIDFWQLGGASIQIREPGFNVTFKFKHCSSSLFSPPSLFAAAHHLLRDCPHGPSMGGDNICTCHVTSLPSTSPTSSNASMPNPSLSLGVWSPTLPTVSSASLLCHWPLLASWLCPLTLLPMSASLLWRRACPKSLNYSAPHSILTSPLVEGCGRYGELLSSWVHVWFEFINYPMQP